MQMERKLFYYDVFYDSSRRKVIENLEIAEFIIKYKLSEAFGNKFPMLFLL